TAIAARTSSPPGSPLSNASKAEASTAELLTFRLASALSEEFVDQRAAFRHMLSHHRLRARYGLVKGDQAELVVFDAQDNLIAYPQAQRLSILGRDHDPATRGNL